MTDKILQEIDAQIECSKEHGSLPETEVEVLRALRVAYLQLLSTSDLMLAFRNRRTFAAMAHEDIEKSLKEIASILGVEE